MHERELNIVGKSVRKIDAVNKVTGQTIYTGDINLPRMLSCKLLRSPHPHARINAIELQTARQQRRRVRPCVHAPLWMLNRY